MIGRSGDRMIGDRTGDGRRSKECPREAEVCEAIAMGSSRLVADHLAACTICSELALVAQALHDDQRTACREAQPPAAGIVWWRATIRARAEAARTASQPITLVQGITGACAAGLAGAFGSMAWRSMRPLESAANLVARLGDARDQLASASAALLQHGIPLLLAVAACLVIAPLALYFALPDE